MDSTRKNYYHIFGDWITGDNLLVTHSRRNYNITKLVNVRNGYLPVWEKGALKRKEIKRKYNLRTERSTSLIDYWKEWNDKYYKAKYPRIMIRYEDLLFHLDETITKVCTCAGGTMKGTPKLPEKSAKSYRGNKHKGNGLVAAIAKAANMNLRLSKMTSEDIAYADKVLQSTELLDVFGYSMSMQTGITRNE